MKAALGLIIANLVSSPGYQVCQVIEDPVGEYPEVTCYNVSDIPGWRQCGSKPGARPGSLFFDYSETFRWEGYVGNNLIPNYEVSGFAHYKEVYRTGDGVARATAFIFRPELGFTDSAEPMDDFTPTSCNYSLFTNQ